MCIKYSRLSAVSAVSVSIELTADWKYSGKKNLKISKKQNLNLPFASNCMLCIYIVFTIYM